MCYVDPEMCAAMTLTDEEIEELLGDIE